mgnify:CR=1 FL=1
MKHLMSRIKEGLYREWDYVDLTWLKIGKSYTNAKSHPCNCTSIWKVQGDKAIYIENNTITININ